MMRTFITVVAISVLVFLDSYTSRLIDEKLREDNAGFARRLNTVDLSLDGPREQGCVSTRIFFLYLYQTCFELIGGNKSIYDSKFKFVYHPPRPFFSLSGLNENSYYFQESALGDVLKVIAASELWNNSRGK